MPPSERSESPLDVFEAEDGKRRWPKRLLIVAAVVVVLGAVYVGASYALADRVPRGATVAGVDIGGLSSDEAVARLDEELADATTQPIEVVANDVQATVDPTAAGLTFDAQATVDELTGVDLAEPARLWAHIAGVGEQDPVTSVDDEALAAAIGDLGTSLALAPVDGTVVFVDASPQSTAAVDGWNLDQPGAADVLASDWLVAARPIELPTATVAPDITQEETDAALVEARQVTSAPVSVSVAGQTALLDAPDASRRTRRSCPTDGNLVAADERRGSGGGRAGAAARPADPVGGRPLRVRQRRPRDHPGHPGDVAGPGGAGHERRGGDRGAGPHGARSSSSRPTRRSRRPSSRRWASRRSSRSSRRR